MLDVGGVRKWNGPAFEHIVEEHGAVDCGHGASPRNEGVIDVAGVADFVGRLDQSHHDHPAGHSIFDTQSHRFDQSPALIGVRKDNFAFDAKRPVEVGLQAHRTENLPIDLALRN